MAYFLKQNEDQNNQNQQTQNVGGNIYSTSGGEVSSQIDNNSNSNNSSNSNSSNSSGNWVNLNSYLDANQNKAGRYANTFVESGLNKGQDYKNNLQNAQDQYLSSIKNDTAYTYNKSKNNNPVYNLLGINATGNDDVILDKYLKDSSSVTQNEKDRAMNILKGYQGDDYFQNTGNKYGYNDLKKTSDDFNNLSKNILNENYLKSQMGNNVSTGGKNLNSFILGGSNDSRNVLNNASNQFSELSSLLDSTNSNLNKERDNVVNIANKNSEVFNDTLNSKAEEIKKKLQEAYDTGYEAYQDKLRRQSENPLAYADNFSNVAGELGELSHNFKAPSNTIIYDTFVDQTDIAKDQLNKELSGINSRLQALQGIVANPIDTSLDSNFEFYTQRAPTEAEIQKQLNDRNYISDLLIDNFGDLRNINYSDPRAVQSLEEARILGWIDDNTFINMIQPYIRRK